MHGKYNVIIKQDPRRIILPEVAANELKFRISEEFGEHAYNKSTRTQRTSYTSNEIETIASVVILSLSEMEDIVRHIKNLESEVAAYKGFIGGLPK
jgi:uncharacterized membrane protein YcgQ (UPF0703/DUF1980 family)